MAGELRRTLLGEASSLLASVRRNPAWAASNLGVKAPAIVGLAAMRSRMMDHRTGPQAGESQLALLLPLLDVIRSVDVSAPFTTCALHSLHRIVLQRLVRADAPDARPAMAALVAAVSKCQFETTDSASSELAISAVFTVLLDTLRNARGLLADAAVGDMVDACFRLNSELNHHKLQISALLRGQAQVTFVQLTHAVFAGLHDLGGGGDFAPPPYQAAAAMVSSEAMVAAAPPPAPAVGGAEGALAPAAAAVAPSCPAAAGLPCIVKLLRFLCAEISAKLPVSPPSGLDSPRRAPQATLQAYAESVAAALAPKLLCLRALVHALEDVHETLATRPELMACVGDELCAALLMLLRFTAAEALVGPGDAVAAGGGDMVNGKLDLTGVPAAAEMLDLQAGVLGHCLQLVRVMWSTEGLRGRLTVQLEVILNSVFLRVLGPAVRQRPAVSALELAQRRSILECLVDMLNEPVALVRLYAMFDCDMARTDVLENLFKLLSETVIGTSARNARGDSGSGGSNDDNDERGEPTELVAKAEADEVLRVLPLQCLCSGLRSLHHVVIEDEATAADSIGRVALAPGAMSAYDLSRLKFRKRALCQGALLFNDKSRDGFKELQRLGVFPTPVEPAQVAEFLRGLPPGLDKKEVGCYLGEAGVTEERVRENTYCTDKASFHAAVLDCFVATFDLTGLSLLASLRTFLSSFRLPGEAQQIDRILVAFSEAAFKQCSDKALLASSDVAYVLSFSVIMLNTDLHNVNIKDDKKMSLKDFYRNNKNYGSDVSKGKDLPEEFLTGIYNSIKNSPFRTLKDGPEGEITPERWGDLLRLGAVMSSSDSSIFKRTPTTDWGTAAAVYTPQIFALIWSPALAGFSSCMQPAAGGVDCATSTVRDGFSMCTQLSSHFGLQVSERVIFSPPAPLLSLLLLLAA